MRQNPKSEGRRPKEIRRPKFEAGHPRISRILANPFAVIRIIRGRFFSDFGFRPSFGLGISVFGFIIAFVLLCASSVRSAGTNLISADDIPPLRPVRPEMPPTFWEQYGAWVVVGCFVLLLAVAVLIWWFARPKPPAIVPPSIEARRALEPLQGKPENGVVLSQVSQILRHYVTAAFDLPAQEMTTTEFCAALVRLERMGPSISVPLNEFLRECDRRKFAAGTSPLQPLQAVSQALRFIDQCEARLADLRQKAAASISPSDQHPVPPASAVQAH